MANDRLKRLARGLERSVDRDRVRIQREVEIEGIRRDAAVEIHLICKQFVDALNLLLTSGHVELTPNQLIRENYQASRETLLQINASGRVIQVSFAGTEPLVTSDNLKTPYTLEGVVQWFNQEMLERDEIREHRLYYCFGKSKNEWRFQDGATYKNGLVDVDYLTGRLEELV